LDNALDALDKHEEWLKDRTQGKRAEFTRVNLRAIDIAGRDLTGARFIACDLRDAKLHGCNLSFADFTCCDLRQADLRKAQAAGVSLFGADLRGADLRGFYAGLGSTFVAADLCGAKMEGMHLKKTDLPGAWIDPADLKMTRFEEVIAPDGSPLNAAINSDADAKEIASRFERMRPKSHATNSPDVAAFEAGSGPTLLDRLEASQKAEPTTDPKKEQEPQAQRAKQPQGCPETVSGEASTHTKEGGVSMPNAQRTHKGRGQEAEVAPGQNEASNTRERGETMAEQEQEKHETEKQQNGRESIATMELGHLRGEVYRRGEYYSVAVRRPFVGKDGNERLAFDTREQDIKDHVAMLQESEKIIHQDRLERAQENGQTQENRMRITRA